MPKFVLKLIYGYIPSFHPGKHLVTETALYALFPLGFLSQRHSLFSAGNPAARISEVIGQRIEAQIKIVWAEVSAV